jgi:hypothetical protein
LPATPPQNPQFQGELGFLFDRLGLRVPAIVVSAYTQANTIINRPVHHAALIRTLCSKYDLGHLTDRDLNAPDREPRELHLVLHVLALDAVRAAELRVRVARVRVQVQGFREVRRATRRHERQQEASHRRSDA